MIQQFQFRRCIFFMCCVSLTVLMIFCYSYSNEFTANLVQVHFEKQIKKLNLDKLQSINENKVESKPVNEQQNLAPQIENITQNSDVVSFFKNMVKENVDFFVKLKDMQMRNVSFSEAGEHVLSETDVSAKPEEQLPDAPILKDLIPKSSNIKPIESNFLSDVDVASTLSPEPPTTLIKDAPNSIQTIPKLPFLGKVSEIYPQGFSYSPSTICSSNDNLQLIIVVTSAPGNFEARKAIRKTWGHFNSTESVKLVFIVGSSIPKNEKKLIEENAQNADIIHGNFVDSYYNLTLKTISMLEWVMNNCQNAKFILKADDDAFINVNKLLELIEPRMYDNKSIYGRLATGWTPHRDPKSKYYISYNEFSGVVYPDFTSGPAYMMTHDCAKLMYNKALGEKYLTLEDVFMTGIIASLVGIERWHLKEFLNEKPGYIDACLLRESVSMHYISPREQYKLWEMFNDENKEC